MSAEPPERPNEDKFPAGIDQYLGAEFMLGPSNPQNLATVIKRARDDKGRPVGKANPNPLLDTREYIVELMDGTRDKYFANQIAENL